MSDVGGPLPFVFGDVTKLCDEGLQELTRLNRGRGDFCHA